MRLKALKLLARFCGQDGKDRKSTKREQQHHLKQLPTDPISAAFCLILQWRCLEETKLSPIFLPHDEFLMKTSVRFLPCNDEKLL